MPDPLLDDLPPLVRLALAYAPAAQRPAFAALFALDQRLARQMDRTSEPLLGQLRLAWWRERLAELPRVPAGEPLLAACAAVGLRGAQTERMLDGWETVLMADNDQAHLAALTGARAALFAALAQAGGQGDRAGRAQQAGQRWALADVAVRAGTGAMGQQARDELQRLPGDRDRLPRSLRSLAMLEGWALAVRQAGDQAVRPSWKDLSVMLRIGLLG